MIKKSWWFIFAVCLLTDFVIQGGYYPLFFATELSAAQIASTTAMTASTTHFIFNPPDYQQLRELNQQQQQLIAIGKEFHQLMLEHERTLTEEMRARLTESMYDELIRWQLIYGAINAPQETDYSQPIELTGAIPLSRQSVPASTNAMSDLAQTLVDNVKVTFRTEPNEMELKEIHHQMNHLVRMSHAQTVQIMQFDEQVSPHFHCKSLSRQYHKYLKQFLADVADVMEEPYGIPRVIKVYNLAAKYGHRVEFANNYIVSMDLLTEEQKVALGYDGQQIIDSIHVTDQLTFELQQNIIEALLASCVDEAGTIVSHTRNLKLHEEESILSAVNELVTFCETDELFRLVPHAQEQWNDKARSQLEGQFTYGKQHESILRSVHAEPTSVTVRHFPLDSFLTPHNSALLKGFMAVDQGDLSQARTIVLDAQLSTLEEEQLLKEITDYAQQLITRVFDHELPQAYMTEGDKRHVTRDPQWLQLPHDVRLMYATNPTMRSIFINRYIMAQNIMKDFGLKPTDYDALPYVYKMVDSIKDKSTHIYEPIFELLHTHTPERTYFFTPDGVCKIFESNSHAAQIAARVQGSNYQMEVLVPLNQILSLEGMVPAEIIELGVRNLDQAVIQQSPQAIESATTICELIYREKPQQVQTIPSLDEVIDLWYTTSEGELPTQVGVLLKSKQNSVHLELQLQNRVEVCDRKILENSNNETLTAHQHAGNSRAYSLLYQVRQIENLYEREIIIQKAEALLAGIDGDPSYISLANQSYATNGEFEQEYYGLLNEIEHEDGREAEKVPNSESSDQPLVAAEQCPPPEQEPEFDEEELSQEQLSQRQKSLDKLNKAVEKWGDQNGKKVKRKLTLKDLDHIERGDPSPDGKIYRGNHMNGRKLEIRGQRVIDSNGSTEGTLVGEGITSKEPKTFFPKGYSIERLISEATTAFEQNLIRDVTGNRVFHVFEFVDSSGTTIRMHFYSKSVTAFPVSPRLPGALPVNITNAQLALGAPILTGLELSRAQPEVSA